jgi:hypothetical protein
VEDEPTTEDEVEAWDIMETAEVLLAACRVAERR